MYIYQADVYCNDCGEQIRIRLEDEGSDVCPENIEDESSYDSSDFPKGPYDDESESDTPQHCARGKDCLCATTLSDGTKVGKFLENSLTDDGITYIIDYYDPSSPVWQLWSDFYSNLYSEVKDSIQKMSK